VVTSSKPLYPGVQKRRRDLWRRFLRKESVKGYLFISPWIIGFLLLSLWPLLSAIYNSFTDYNVFEEPHWVGFANYAQILTRDRIFVQVCLNMLLYMTGSTVLTIASGLLFALLLNRKFVGNHFFRMILYVPSLLNGVAIGIMFKQIFSSGDYGLFNQFLSVFHVQPVNWLANYDYPQVALLAVMLVNLWFVGGAMLPFLAGLKGISVTYYEAARIDGAGVWRTFCSITLPLLSPIIVFNTIMTLIGHLQVFAIPLAFASSGSLISNANPLGYHNSLGTFLTYLYVRAFVQNDLGYGSALAVIIFCITLVLTLLVLWVSRRFAYYAFD
jgi:ABC-type sugar transport system permease subunit